MKLPEIDLEGLKRKKEKNFQERLEFIKWYTEWVKKTPNKIWSRQQKDLEAK